MVFAGFRATDLFERCSTVKVEGEGGSNGLKNPATSEKAASFVLIKFALHASFRQLSVDLVKAFLTVEALVYEIFCNFLASATQTAYLGIVCTMSRSRNKELSSFTDIEDVALLRGRVSWIDSPRVHAQTPQKTCACKRRV